MKRFAMCVGAVLFVLSSHASNAVERYHSSPLKFVYPTSDGNFILGFNTDSADCTGAGAPKYMYVAVGQNGVTADGAKKMYAAALTAFALGKPVSLAFDDSTPSCYINRMSFSN